MLDMIQWLYPFSWLFALCSFSPQILRLVRTKSSAQDLSLPSWLMFLANACLGWSYAFFVVEDGMLIVSASLVAVANVCLVSVLIYKRMKYRSLANPMAMPA
ncbi:hypothetical protein DBZ36_02885 [Alginatibacterium sediminis]|uniref:PQ-loop repeat-containing protein n=1 Tax=Alginatibacterium sediminis TaxID=2164068 RepID=A0A420EJR2_9ALTE|nr:hypothetical protein [Alginatibacterium sediminis]RKF20904.1 hypothetical protein DBZ36_02885 [Alginatibacterium sediminis]